MNVKDVTDDLSAIELIEYDVVRAREDGSMSVTSVVNIKRRLNIIRKHLLSLLPLDVEIEKAEM